MKLIEVEWEDISGNGSWDDAKGDYTDDLITCKTVGWQLKSNKKVLVTASTVTKSGRCCDRTVIPRKVIKSIKRLA